MTKIYSNENLDALLDCFMSMTEHYNQLKATSTECWEQETLDTLILSEKVFNI